MKPLLLVLFAFIFFISPVHGQVYKWTDKNGKVHYSDKPNNNANTKSTGVVDFEDNPLQVAGEGFPPPLPEKPIYKPEDMEIHRLYVTTKEFPWKQFATSPYKKIGGFSKGPGCNYFEEKRWNDMFNEFSAMLPNGLSIKNKALQTMYDLGYESTPIDMDKIMRVQREKKAYALVPTIINIRYDSCITKPGKYFFRVWRKRRNTDFNRHRVAIVVEWNLTDPTGKVVYSKTAQGVSDRWDIDMQGQRVVLEAIGNTVSYLFSDQKVVDLLTKEKKKGFFSKFL